MKTRSTQFSSLCQRGLRLEQLECRRALDASAVLDDVPLEWHSTGPRTLTSHQKKSPARWWQRVWMLMPPGVKFTTPAWS